MRLPRPVQPIWLLAGLITLSACGSGAGPSATAATLPGSTEPPAVTPTIQPAAPSASIPVDPTATQIHLVKDCSAFTGQIPSHCTISGSDYAPIPIGAKVNYLGPLLINPHFLSSNVRLDDGRGSTATGYCMFDGRPADQRGLCSFWDGSGALAGFTAIFVVTIDATGKWHLDGESYGTSPSPGPS